MKTNYRICDGCWNCRHVHRVTEDFETDDYYCGKDGGDIPKHWSEGSGNHSLHGSPPGTFYYWARGRDCHEHAICDDYERREEDHNG